MTRGEHEGATVWFRSEGDSGPYGKADLVFVVKQVGELVLNVGWSGVDGRS